MESGLAFYPQGGLTECHFDGFSYSRQIESRSVRSMRNDLTKTAQAAREPEMYQIKVFKAPPPPVDPPVVYP